MDARRLLDGLVDAVVKEQASDLHLISGRNPTIRVGGFLVPFLKQPVLDAETIAELTDVLLAPEDKERFIQEKEIDFSFSPDGKARFRGNGYFEQGAIGFALRFIPTKIRTLQELNLPEILGTFTERRQGFFLVVGPVGHGKTTTLAALVDKINHERSEHIVTIEDPVEYLFQPDKSMISQREVRHDTKNFHSALRASLRQDVNVLMVGEMRSIETMSAAVTAAETGHLIFSTLHTNNAAQTIDRIIDSFAADQQDQIRIQLASSLAGVFSQRLVPRISGGLIPAYELLINTPAVANLIREKRTHELSVVIETGRDQGMVDMNRMLTELVRAGEITVESAYLHSLAPKGLEQLI